LIVYAYDGWLALWHEQQQQQHQEPHPQESCHFHNLFCLASSTTESSAQYSHHHHAPIVTSLMLAKILFILWIAQRLAVHKKYLLTLRFQNVPKALGRIAVYNRLGNGMVMVVTILCLCAVLDVELGWNLTSVFAFGSAGTLIVGLASRDLASMLVAGLALSLTDRIRVGDEVYFGDGTCGIIQEMGWMCTTLRQFDEVLVDIPNNQLGMQRVKNVSRCQLCRVKQTLRFHYRDAAKLTPVLEELLQEIKTSCPTVISDGSRPFRAFLVNYQDSYLEAFVDVHFHGRPSGHKYWANRHEVMLAIHRVVVERHGLEMVMVPSLAQAKLNKYN